MTITMANVCLHIPFKAHTGSLFFSISHIVVNAAIVARLITAYFKKLSCSDATPELQLEYVNSTIGEFTVLSDASSV